MSEEGRTAEAREAQREEGERGVVAYLRSPVAIRECCGRLFDLACADDRLRYFGCDLGRLDEVAGYVVRVMREQYPDLQVPFHSRWRHFEVGGVPRVNRLAELPLLERVRAKVDLAVVSVLLDAGAGELWQYSETDTAQVFRRSEGLAVASFWMFCQAVFSGNRGLQVNAQGLQGLTQDVLVSGFQVSLENPLVGLAGRLELLQRLGRSLLASPRLFGSENPRPGHLVDYFLEQSSQGQLSAETVLSAVLVGLGDIWPGRLEIAGVNLGDVWYHSALAAKDGQLLWQEGLVPFHKLSQWLTYSLLEPLQELGLEIVGLDALTGLPEYRNGGLCLDLGLLQVKDPAVLQQRHSVGSEVIVEWRALTVILLDRIAAVVREQLGMSAEELPLVKVLQGGTWSAGRRIAAQLRAGGVPPIQVVSDGTVF